MFNVGQMPFFDVPAGDGGDGEPEDVAKAIYAKEVVCLSEMWSNDDIDDLLTEVNELRESEGMKDFEYVGVESDYHDVANLWDGDGIMLLSARPIIATDEIAYDECSGVDCLADKGAIWARVLIDGGEPTNEMPGNADNFVDVFCTHLNNNDTDTSMTVSDPKAARQAQLEQLHKFVVAKAAPDRPAFVLGDLNVKADSSEYPFLIVTMDALPTPFDMLNFQLVDEKDLGLLASPVQGTFMGSDCTVDEVDQLPSLGRFDYVLAISGTQEWPDWAIAAADTQVDPVFLSLGAYDAECLSDHAMVTSHVELIHSTVPPKWNPLKDHKVTFTVTKLVDHASGGCCADWYTPVLWLDPESKDVSDDDTDDGDTVYPGDTWNISAVLTDHDVSSMNVEVWDWDAGNDDHYDMTDSGLDPVYEIDHWYGDWNRLDENWTYDDTVGNFNDFPDGIYIETHGTSSVENYGDTGLSLTAVELP
jgi:endonuclease/exonuclease/phosphatase family metal-dependent hydrolase